MHWKGEALAKPPPFQFSGKPGTLLGSYFAPAETWITHGREEALLRWCELNQRKARALAMVGYEDEDD